MAKPNRIRRGDTVKLGGLTCKVVLTDADGRLWIRDQSGGAAPHSGDNYVVWWHRVRKDGTSRVKRSAAPPLKQSITRAKAAGKAQSGSQSATCA